MGVIGSKGASQRPWASSTGEMLFWAEAAAAWMDTGRGLEGHLLQRPWALMKRGQGWEERKNGPDDSGMQRCCWVESMEEETAYRWKEWIWLWVCWVWSGVLSWRFLKEKPWMQRERAGREMLWVRRNLKGWTVEGPALPGFWYVGFFFFFFCFVAPVVSAAAPQLCCRNAKAAEAIFKETSEWAWNYLSYNEIY